MISRDFDTVLLGEASVPRARVLGSIVEISTPNSSLEISSIDQTRMAVTEQTSAFSCNLRENFKILKEKITFPSFNICSYLNILYEFVKCDFDYFLSRFKSLNDPRLEISRWILITTENNNFGRMDPLAIANQVHEKFFKTRKDVHLALSHTERKLESLMDCENDKY